MTIAPGFATITISHENLTQILSVEVLTSKEVSVKDYGAYGEGISDETNSFQNAIDDLAEKGGGKLFIPEGREYI